MRQFVIALVQGLYSILVVGQYSAVLTSVGVGYMVSLLALFGHFYVRKHWAAAPARKAAAAKAAPVPRASAASPPPTMRVLRSNRAKAKLV